MEFPEVNGLTGDGSEMPYLINPARVSYTKTDKYNPDRSALVFEFGGKLIPVKKNLSELNEELFEDEFVVGGTTEL